MHAKEKEQSHAQDNIYVVWQFVYIHEVAEISLLSGKKYKVWLQFFLSHKNTTTKKNPNNQIGFSSSENLSLKTTQHYLGRVGSSN